MKTRVKALLLSGLAGGMGLAALAAAQPAMAADVEAPAYKAAPATVFSWSGFYFGGTVGGGMASLPVTDLDDVGGFIGDGAFPNGQSLKSGGAVGGLHAGYNWQFTPSFLVGIEGDFNWSGFEASDTTRFSGCTFCETFTAASKLDDFSTFRARFGFTSDRTMVYVTAGPGWGHINASLSDFSCPGCANPGALNASASDNSFHIGIAAGAGVEYALTANWILRGEYLHLDFGSKDTLFKTPTGSATIFGGGPFRASSTATADIARLGVSYKIW